MASNQKNLDIVIRGRNEAKAAMKDANKDASSLASTFLKIAAGGAAISIASKAGAAAVMGWIASNEKAAALAHGSLTDVYEAQIKVNTAYSELGGSIPIIGESVKKAMDAMYNTDAIRKKIEQIKALEAATKSYHDLNQKMLQENALRAAELAGQSATEIQGIKNKFRADDNKKTRDDMIRNEAEARSALGDAIIAREKKERELAKAKGPGNWKEGFDPFGFAQETIKDELHEAKVVEDKTRSIYEAAAKARHEFELNADKEASDKEALLAKQAAARAAQEQMAAERAMIDYLANEEERRVNQAIVEGARLKALAKDHGGDVADIEAETARRIQAIHDEARAKEQQAREKEKADRERDAKQREREEQAYAKTKAQYANIIFNATHTAQERELRELKQAHDDALELYKDDAEMKKHIDAAYAIERAEINHRYGQGATPRNVEVQALSSRFLTRAQGRDDPKWAQEANKEAKKHSALLEQIAKKCGVTVQEFRLN